MLRNIFDLIFTNKRTKGPQKKVVTDFLFLPGMTLTGSWSVVCGAHIPAFIFASFRVARLNLQTRKLWLVGRCRARLLGFLFICFPFLSFVDNTKITPLRQRDPKQRFLFTSVGRSLLDDDERQLRSAVQQCCEGDPALQAVQKEKHTRVQRWQRQSR